MQDFLIPAERLGESYTTWQRRMRIRGYLLAAAACACGVIMACAFFSLLVLGGVV
jgi:hypothetical protein